MPTQDWGVYEDSLTLGTEVSSTYEGRHITATAAELNHGNVLAVVTKGYPVIFDIVAGAHGVGVAFNTEVAGADLIAVDTEGIWNLSVVASDDAANSLVVAGDPLYINTTTAVISKIRNNATQIPFGYALAQANGDGLAHTIAVKVHWDPRSHWLEDLEMLYFGDARDVSVQWDPGIPALEMLPLVDDTGAFNIGDGTFSMDFQVFGLTANDFLHYNCQTGELQLTMTALGAATRMMRVRGTSATPNYGDGIGCNEYQLDITGDIGGLVALNSNWINIGTDAVIDSYMFINTDGFWDGTGTLTSAYMAWSKITFNLASDPAWLSFFEINAATPANDTINSIFNVNNEVSAMGFVGGDHDDDTNVGSIPMYSVAHGTIRWVRVYAAAA